MTHLDAAGDMATWNRRFKRLQLLLAAIALSSWLVWHLLPAGYLKGLVFFVGASATFMVVLIGAKKMGASTEHDARRQAIVSAKEALINDPRPPVVYFRSFDDDLREAASVYQLNVAVGSIGQWERSAEEVLGGYLNAIGPVVTIGRPGEPIPEPGFARMYVEQDRWQARVVDLVDRAALVVLRAGHSPGVLWETDQILRRLALHRVIVLVPAAGAFNYDKYREQVRSMIGLGLPALSPSALRSFPLGIRAIVRFDLDGNPCLCEPSDPGVPPPSKFAAPGWLYRWGRKKGAPWFRPPTTDFSSFLIRALKPIFAEHSLACADPATQFDDRMRPTTLDRVMDWLAIVALVGLAGLVTFAVVLLVLNQSG